MVTPAKIFISYARKDGKAHALDLQTKLNELGFSAWLDTNDIIGGEDWFAQIKKAIDESEYMVLVATPMALDSDNVRDEWRYARKIGVRVYPIIYPDTPIDFEKLPKHIGKRHFYHSDKTWDSFINHLRAPYERDPVPFMAEALPAHFVNRPQIEAELLKYLLKDDPHHTIAITTALKGSGGFGKTMMAQAICHHDAVYDRFINGILWVTLGESPDVLLALRKVYKALTGKDGIFSDTEEGGRLFGEALTDKDCLIVIDDVWNSVHLQPFLRGGERCARLITTRDTGIAVRANAKMTEVDEMTITEARAMLRGGVSDIANADLDALAIRLGRWALMLELTNAMLRERQASTNGTWADAYAHIIRLLDRRGVKGIQTENAEKRKQGADGVLSVSLELLKIDEHEPTRLCELGIFKDDQDVPVSSVMALWSMDDFDTEDLLTKFARLSLIKYRSSTASIRLHDVVREYLLTNLPNLVVVHNQLLRGYGDPYTLPDVYAWRFYAYHLVGANRLTELRPLLLSYRWLNVKLHHTEPNALIDDCKMLLEQVKDETIRLIRSAISMSAHVLEKDDNALAHQLAGRLMHHYTKVDEIRVFMDVVMTTPNNLFPAFPDSEYDILNPAGGMMLRTLKHDGWVRGAIQLRDGRILSWSDDKTLRLWDADGTPIATLTGHTDGVNGAIELGDGRLLSWSGDSTLHLWDADGTPIAILTGHTSHVRGAVQLVDSRILSWSWDNTLRLWDAHGTPLATLLGHMDRVHGATQLQDGRILSWVDNRLSESKDKTLRLWNTNGTPFAVLTGHMSNVNGALELANGRILSWSDDNTLRLWNADGTPFAVLTGHTDNVNGALELANGRILSWAGGWMNRDYMLRLWDADGMLIANLAGHTSHVHGAVQLVDGRLLSWSGDNMVDDTLHLWDANGSSIVALTRHTKGVAGAMQLSNGRILSWGWDKTLRLWDANGSPIVVLMGHTKGVAGAMQLVDGRLLSWSGDNTLRLWDANGSPIVALIGHTKDVRGAVELRDGRVLSWSKDNILRMWGADGMSVVALTGHTNDVNGAIELGDGRLLSWGGDNILRMWGADGSPIAILTGHISWVNGVIELSDGQLLSWGGDSFFVMNPEIRLWKQDGKPIDVLEQDYWRGDRLIIAEWAQKHGYTQNDLYPPEDEQDPLLAGVRVRWNKDSTDLIIYDPQTGATVHTFYCDAWVSHRPIVTRKKIMVAGDEVGRVLFLRWVGDNFDPLIDEPSKINDLISLTQSKKWWQFWRRKDKK